MLLVSSALNQLSSTLGCSVGFHTGKSSDLYLGFQCFSADTIATFSFSTCFNQLSFPDFHGDLVEGIDIAIPTITLMKFSAVFVWIIRNFPSWLLKISSPRLKGLVIFKEVSIE